MALADNALTTVATLAYELGLPEPAAGSPAEKDLERRIAVASKAVEDYCDRRFGRATLTEKVRGMGGQVLMLDRCPVLSITSVTLDGQVVPVAEYECVGVDAAAGLLRTRYGRWANTADWQRGVSPEPLAGTERAAYTVVYVAGYVLPKDAAPGSPSTLPAPLEEACLLTAVASYRAKGRDPSIVSQSLLSASVSYAGSAVNTAIGLGVAGIIPDSAAYMLQPYRRLT
ncbi:hypothetical protein [Myxococcus virescens]|uniref:Phage gp6-like head-tail connector protein n=1 Tax=Myxococcus virescens TaxID=83456 RepID=A0A511HPB8_9BACT|nr:hypothetical protein [Myxococcus virescens]GEL75205.1 hypothetical protein MVI01_69890 [Myxococcus virescens]SDD65204.1 hypothetical protein SAMN04488504_102130 [Myxococcus virescens]